MNRKLLLSAALAAAIPLLPSAVAAQTDQQTQAGQSQGQKGCRDAISAVDQKLEGMKQQRDAWNRAQVQLYIAEQFLSEGQPENCSTSVREAHKILASAQSGTAASDTAQPGQETNPTQSKDTGPEGANITGMDTEGWGTNEAQLGGGKPDEKSAPAQ